MITKNSRIYIAGHKGLVGSSVLKVLREKGYGEKDLKDYFYDNY